MFHVKHEGWAPAVAGFELDPLPNGAESLLTRYEDLLVGRGGPMGLVAANDLPRIRERHMLDCLRGAALIEDEPLQAYDLGSGGGLPGIVLAIARPNVTLTLVEVRKNRASFLMDVIRELGLGNVNVHPRRVETLRERRDLCTARAFAPLPKAWIAAAPLLSPEGRLIYWAGASFDPVEDLPDGVSAELHPAAGLEGAGSLVEIRADR